MYSNESGHHEIMSQQDRSDHFMCEIPKPRSVQVESIWV